MQKTASDPPFALVPASTSSLVSDFCALGLEHSQVVLVHASLCSLGYVIGGAQAVIEALLEVVGSRGTIVMPAHSGDLSEPSHWSGPPAPAAWWTAIRESLPAFDPAKTPTYRMGTIAETFRGWPAVQRSNHPTASFAAHGPHAARIVRVHMLEDGFGEHSPLARLYELDAQVLLLGVGHDSNSALHLAERRALGKAQPVRATGSPIFVRGERRWVTFEEPASDASDFLALGAALETQTTCVATAQVATAHARRVPMRALVDFATGWLREQRSR
jgi:aminoglycoside 3-N-acetyltransferase